MDYEVIRDLITFFVIPLFVWVWFTDRKLSKIESITLNHSDLKELYKKLDEIKKDIHDLNDKFVSSKSCDFRHSKQ